MTTVELQATAPPPTSGASGLAWGLLLAGAVGVLTWSATGSLAETDPIDADFLWRPIPALEDHRGLLGGAAAGAAVVAVGMLARTARRGVLPAWRLVQVAVLALFGAWVGLGYGIVTAPTVGANIGGGFFLLTTPVVAVLTAVLVGVLEVVGRRRT